MVTPTVVDRLKLNSITYHIIIGVDQNLRDTRTERERYRVQYKFTIAASRAREAVARERSNPAWAHEIWRSLFGSVYKY